MAYLGSKDHLEREAILVHLDLMDLEVPMGSQVCQDLEVVMDSQDWLDLEARQDVLA